MSQHGCPERLSNRSKGFPDEGQATMEVLVETLTGTAFEITVSPSDTIFAIKSKICRVEGIPVSQQHLLYNLVELEDSLSLASAGVTSGSRLRLVLGLRGGPIATRRLPPPIEPWPDIDDRRDNNRDEDWCSGGSGCKVTVLVYRDGERVSMVRVRENTDGTYSPLDTTNYGSSLTHVCEQDNEASGDRSEELRLTKVAGLRERLRDLALTHNSGDKPEIQKTRSEETLSVPSLLDEPDTRTYTPYSEADDTFTPLYDGNYTRYDYDFTDKYTILPPIGTRSDSDQSVQDDERLKCDVAGAILVKGPEEDILEECLEEACHTQEPTAIAAKSLAPIPAAEYGPLVGGEATSWRGRSFVCATQGVAVGAPSGTVGASGGALGGGGGALGAGGGALGAGGGARTAHAHSASSLAGGPVRPPHARPHIADALFSSSTSDLDHLKSRILPALSRHRNREHLHLSDEGLHLTTKSNIDVHRTIDDIAENSKFDFDDQKKEEKEVKEKKIRIRCGFCRKRLSIATVHKCRCGAQFCAPHRYAEVHGCAYDYKANAHQYLQRANPLVSAPKLPKI